MLTAYAAFDSCNIEVDVWYHLRATWDLGDGGSGIKIYLNGNLLDNNIENSVPIGNISYVRFGNTTSASAHVVLDEFYITNNPHSQEILTAFGTALWERLHNIIHPRLKYNYSISKRHNWWNI